MTNLIHIIKNVNNLDKTDNKTHKKEGKDFRLKDLIKDFDLLIYLFKILSKNNFC